MCGIGGELRFDGRTADAEAVGRMLPCLQMRGPDGEGFWHRGPVALGHRRLKIIDLSEAGAQPMTDEELGLTLVFNGCIYNYQQLRDELRSYGYRFFSTSDTEVIIKAYHRWGADCVTHFLGMFAFALVEHETGVVVLARDRLGIKPMYLAETPGRLRFASNLQALLAAGDVDTTLDKVALQHYMTFHSVVPAPRTILTGIRKLPPATVRVIQPDGTSTESVYWEASFTRGIDHVASGVGGRGPREAPGRGRAADGRRRAGRRAALRRARLQLHRGAAGRAGAAGADHVQHRLRGGGGRGG